MQQGRRRDKYPCSRAVLTILAQLYFEFCLPTDKRIHLNDISTNKSTRRLDELLAGALLETVHTEIKNLGYSVLVCNWVQICKSLHYVCYKEISKKKLQFTICCNIDMAVMQCNGPELWHNCNFQFYQNLSKPSKCIFSEAHPLAPFWNCVHCYEIIGEFDERLLEIQ